MGEGQTGGAPEKGRMEGIHLYGGENPQGPESQGGVLKEPPHHPVSARKGPRPRPYATRKPKEYQVRLPGELVQVDTLDLRPLPGVVLKHFTARDVFSRWDVLEVHTRATANTAREFLDTLQGRMPFPIKALQVDGGSEFQGGLRGHARRRG